MARELFDIFCQFGTPVILQSDNGKEFRNQVVSSLKTLWSGLTLVHGRARHPQTQGSVERCNGDVQIMLCNWMREHRSTNWSFGIKVVQYQKNLKHHRGINSSPYNALFGHESYDGINIFTTLTSDQKSSLKTVKQLFELLGKLFSVAILFVSIASNNW